MNELILELTALKLQKQFEMMLLKSFKKYCFKMTSISIKQLNLKRTHFLHLFTSFSFLFSALHHHHPWYYWIPPELFPTKNYSICSSRTSAMFSWIPFSHLPKAFPISCCTEKVSQTNDWEPSASANWCASATWRMPTWKAQNRSGWESTWWFGRFDYPIFWTLWIHNTSKHEGGVQSYGV